MNTCMFAFWFLDCHHHCQNMLRNTWQRRMCYMRPRSRLIRVNARRHRALNFIMKYTNRKTVTRLILTCCVWPRRLSRVQCSRSAPVIRYQCLVALWASASERAALKFALLHHLQTRADLRRRLYSRSIAATAVLLLGYYYYYYYYY